MEACRRRHGDEGGLQGCSLFFPTAREVEGGKGEGGTFYPPLLFDEGEGAAGGEKEKVEEVGGEGERLRRRTIEREVPKARPPFARPSH